MNNSIEVCLSPLHITQFDLNDALVVVVDILRATSCITSGLANGIQAIKPVKDKEECRTYKEKGYIIAGERNGKKIVGFDIGNSPLEYQKKEFKGKKIAMSTTNGVKAITQSKAAHQIIIGSFLNADAVIQHILEANKNTIIHCSGWKDSINIEDTLFAGYVLDHCVDFMHCELDSSLLAHQLYLANRDDPTGLVLRASHARRLERYKIGKDIRFCMKIDEFKVLPILKDHHIQLN